MRRTVVVLAIRLLTGLRALTTASGDQTQDLTLTAGSYDTERVVPPPHDDEAAAPFPGLLVDPVSRKLVPAIVMPILADAGSCLRSMSHVGPGTADDTS